LAGGRHERARDQGRRRREKGGGDQALGRSRGGFGTKIHLLTDSLGVPLAAILSPGERHESLFLEALVEAGARETGRLPRSLACDRAYSAPRIRRFLATRGIEPVIPHRKDELARMDDPEPLDRAAYRKRNAVERCVGWMKEMRGVATRSDKLAQSFLGMVHLAMIRVCLRRIELSDTA
jgi:transposase